MALALAIFLLFNSPGAEGSVKSPAVAALVQHNPELSEEEALKMWRTVKRTVKRFKADPVYSKGAAMKVTPELILTIILVESGGKESAKSKGGAKGLMQIVPKHHIDSLCQAGIISKADAKELWGKEKNIMAGTYILMCYARSSKTIAEALARYNAGGRVDAGARYARKVLRWYGLVFGLNTKRSV